ncbi:hypothetical protein HYH03_015330 [Edaphochlamys debaryana]|uniref:C-type lectin domain-containing protein n=1 Tax=Edaphochlamys debaryana TaxID=47281 RepID=A0A835XJR0_9CHLO|nr:hypothetical protein HYH03_015330 [Edaphochlamys debaryana]|eukprot:KAG2486017.1 hypothetical protein HYH03_015330 [Edaphochlamys debaryana]
MAAQLPADDAEFPGGSGLCGMLHPSNASQSGLAPCLELRPFVCKSGSPWQGPPADASSPVASGNNSSPSVSSIQVVPGFMYFTVGAYDYAWSRSIVSIPEAQLTCANLSASLALFTSNGEFEAAADGLRGMALANDPAAGLNVALHSVWLDLSSLVGNGDYYLPNNYITPVNTTGMWCTDVFPYHNKPCVSADIKLASSPYDPEASCLRDVQCTTDVKREILCRKPTPVRPTTMSPAVAHATVNGYKFTLWDVAKNLTDAATWCSSAHMSLADFINEAEYLAVWDALVTTWTYTSPSTDGDTQFWVGYNYKVQTDNLVVNQQQTTPTVGDGGFFTPNMTIAPL